MDVSEDLNFTFDVQGYLHLRGALSAPEVAEQRALMEQAQDTNIATLNADNPAATKDQLNRPLSRFIDADPHFARLLDHPAVEPLMREFLGQDYRHIDNDLFYTYPDFAGGHWHRGVRAHPTGHVVDGQFICPMVKIFYCLTDVGPGEGEFVVVPGSHKAQFEIDITRVDLPGQHCFDDVAAGDVIIFNEALLHNGRPNPSTKTRQTLIINCGRADAGVWPGYAPLPATLEALTWRQRAIMGNGNVVWSEPNLVGAS